METPNTQIPKANVPGKRFTTDYPVSQLGSMNQVSANTTNSSSILTRTCTWFVEARFATDFNLLGTGDEPFDMPGRGTGR